MNNTQALLVSIRDTPVENATLAKIGHHPDRLRACLRKGLARVENDTLALTDRGRAAILHIPTQRCQGCVGLYHGNDDVCVLALGQPVGKVSPRWCPGKVRPVV